MKKYYPLFLTKYLTKEFIKCLLIIFAVFLSISLLINFVEEIVYFKEKKLNNFLISTIYLTLCKTPNTIIETSIFIFLFSGIFFFVKFLKNSEFNTIKLSGLSNIFIILVPAICSFIIGIFIISFITPISAEGLKIYEKNRRLFSQNDNLIVINDTGLWFMERKKNKHNIIRADRIVNNDFTKLYNTTIYELDENFSFIKRYDSKLTFINKKNWILENATILDNNLIKEVEEIKFLSTIDINELKNLFTNVNTISFWEIIENINILNLRGYSGDELKVKYHQYLSLPFYLFSMIILATVFTLGLKKNYNNFIFIFFGVVAGVFIYFLNDLSITIGLSYKIPLILSVWIPIFLILGISTINLLKINEK